MLIRSREWKRVRSRLGSVHAELFFVRLACSREGDSPRAFSPRLADSSLCGGREDLLARESFGHCGAVPAALHASRRNHGVSAHGELSVDQLAAAGRAVRRCVARCVRLDREERDRRDSGSGGVRLLRVSVVAKVSVLQGVEEQSVPVSAPDGDFAELRSGEQRGVPPKYSTNTQTEARLP